MMKYLRPFFTNLSDPVYAFRNLPPELCGALCSRASRASEDIREVFLKEYVQPVLEGDTGDSFTEYVQALNDGLADSINNEKARAFYRKWLAQYGDDSIAQMAGTHLVFTNLSQIAIKHLEDMRIGIAPIEKSTRYVSYADKVDGHYLYHIPDEIQGALSRRRYRDAMDKLFENYGKLITEYTDYLHGRYPGKSRKVCRTKAFDTFRGLLPLATISQVAFFANGQAFEYLINRSLNHPLDEIRQAGEAARRELEKVIPSFLSRLSKPQTQDYQEYLGKKKSRLSLPVKDDFTSEPPVKLIRQDGTGEEWILASMIYPHVHASLPTIYEKVRAMTCEEKMEAIRPYMESRRERWYKVDRAFETSHVTWEIICDIGAWRDIHRHRMLSHFRQPFTVHHGYDIPDVPSCYRGSFVNSIHILENLYKDIHHDFGAEIAQYAVSLAHKVRFSQTQNLRSAFWEIELRTGKQGHPSYRWIEQEKARLLQGVYPVLATFLKVDWKDYEFARR